MCIYQESLYFIMHIYMWYYQYNYKLTSSYINADVFMVISYFQIYSSIQIMTCNVWEHWVTIILKYLYTGTSFFFKCPIHPHPGTPILLYEKVKVSIYNLHSWSTFCWLYNFTPGPCIWTHSVYNMSHIPLENAHHIFKQTTLIGFHWLIRAILCLTYLDEECNMKPDFTVIFPDKRPIVPAQTRTAHHIVFTVKSGTLATELIRFI